MFSRFILKLYFLTSKFIIEIYLELIIFICDKVVATIHIFIWISQLTSIIYFKILCFSHCTAMSLFSWNWLCLGLFLNVLFYSVGLLSILVSISHSLNHYSFKISLQSDRAFVLLQDYFDHLDLLYLHINFRISLWISIKNTGILAWFHSFSIAK